MGGSTWNELGVLLSLQSLSCSLRRYPICSALLSTLYGLQSRSAREDCKLISMMSSSVDEANAYRRNTTISGGIAIQAGFLVSFKQLVPEHTVSLFRGMIKMRVKHFPAIFLLANILSGVLFATDTAMYLSCFGFFTSWIYLRFYRRTESLSTSETGEGSYIRGDASDTFAFAHFFPEPIYTPVAKITEEVWKVLLALKVCTPFSDEDVDAGNEQASARAEGGLPSIMNSKGGSGGGRREEAERRRALALKALDQRLQVAASRGVAQKPVEPAASSVQPPSSSTGEADVRSHETET